MSVDGMQVLESEPSLTSTKSKRPGMRAIGVPKSKVELHVEEAAAGASGTWTAQRGSGPPSGAAASTEPSVAPPELDELPDEELGDGWSLAPEVIGGAPDEDPASMIPLPLGSSPTHAPNAAPPNSATRMYELARTPEL